jgi:hypothetical protein
MLFWNLLISAATAVAPRQKPPAKLVRKHWGCGFGSALNGGNCGGNFGGTSRIANLRIPNHINNLHAPFGSRLDYFSYRADPGMSRKRLGDLRDAEACSLIIAAYVHAAAFRCHFARNRGIRARERRQGSMATPGSRWSGRCSCCLSMWHQLKEHDFRFPGSERTPESG